MYLLRRSFLYSLLFALGDGKMVAYVRCEYPLTRARIRKISAWVRARSQRSIAGRGKVHCSSSYCFICLHAKRVRQAPLPTHSLRVYFAIITFSRLAHNVPSSVLINVYRCCAKHTEYLIDERAYTTGTICLSKRVVWKTWRFLSLFFFKSYPLHIPLYSCISFIILLLICWTEHFANTVSKNKTSTSLIEKLKLFEIYKCSFL